MKTMWGLGLLCLVATLSSVHSSPIRKTGKAAPLEEVNVLMYGIIQLSESINHVYESTEAKMEKIRQVLERHEGALRDLGMQAEQAAAAEEKMKEMMQLLQIQTTTQQEHTQMTKDKLSSIEEDEIQLKNKVERLETHLDQFEPVDIVELKERAEENFSILQNLQLFAQFQKETMDAENEQLFKLQKMSEAVA